MSNLDSPVIAALTDLRPADDALVKEVRDLAEPIGSALAMLSPPMRADKFTQTLDTAIALGARPEDTATIVPLLVLLLDANCRARACSRIGTGHEALPHLDLWLHVTRYTLGSPPERLPLTIAGFAAARAGHPCLARDCLARAMQGAPALPDTRAYRDALDQHTAPEHWRPYYPVP